MANLITASDESDKLYWNIEAPVAAGTNPKREDVLLVQFLLSRAMLVRVKKVGKRGTETFGSFQNLRNFTGVVDLDTLMCILAYQNAAYGKSDGRVSAMADGRASYGASRTYRTIALLQLDYVSIINNLGRLSSTRTNHNDTIRRLSKDPTCPTELAHRLSDKTPSDPFEEMANVTDLLSKLPRPKIVF
jgi:hypothetical protein